mmetsp:Transcript_30275/g.81948  ORF Transcript_30275/g.81948 Transcript_30275/m.81948 type:complete len:200 (-) Transcript_30275:26-625(-)
MEARRSQHSFLMGLLVVLPRLHVPLHLEPEWGKADHDADKVAHAPDGDPAVCHKHEVAKLPEAIEEVGKPALGHRRPPIVVATGAVIDTPDRGDATGRMLLTRIANALDELLVLWDVCHALRNVLDRGRNVLCRLQLGITKAWSTLWRHLAKAEGLLLRGGCGTEAHDLRPAERQSHPTAAEQPCHSAKEGRRDPIHST